MRRFIFEKINEMKDKKVFSMPGHKSKDVFDFDYKYDVTEIMDTDNLLDPSGCILESERAVADVFGVKDSFYIVNGSTAALYTAISTATEPGDRILIMRSCHKSVYNAMVLNDLVPEYIMPEYDKKSSLITGIDIDELEGKLRDNNIKAVVLTSPSYYGIILDLRKISEVVHRYGAYLIVDEAHGTHFVFSDLKEYSAVNYADFIVHSTHKTTPSFTQSAILHINTGDFTREDVLRYCNLYLSTSPSYLLMQSSEFAIDFMDKNGVNLLSRNNKYIDAMKERLCGKVEFFEEDLDDGSYVKYDPTKILFKIRGMSGFEIVKKLYLGYNIRLEMGDLKYALALSTVCDEFTDFKALEDALLEIACEKTEEEKEVFLNEIVPDIVYTPRQAYYMRREFVGLDEASGRVAAGIVAAYPPGIPILASGERISSEIIFNIKMYLNAGIEVVGVENGRIEVIK